MSYTPTEWKTGDVVTAEKLNNIEDELVKLDKTIRLTFKSSKDNYTVYSVHSTYVKANKYVVGFSGVGEDVTTDNDITLLFNCRDADSLIMDIFNCVEDIDITVQPTIEGDASLDDGILTLNGDATITFAGTPEEQH